MRVNEDVRKCVVFLGVVSGSGAFAPYGTAFVCLWMEGRLGYQYLVTARHVLRDMESSGRPKALRINRVDGGAELVAIDGAPWHFHPVIGNCDVGVAAFGLSMDTFDFRAVGLDSDVLSPDYIEENYVGAGDDVFTTGLLVNHFGTAKNIPVVRVGNIAAMPEEPIDLGEPLGMQEVFLIESRSIGGLSGSPVFLHTPPFRVNRQGQIDQMIGHRREYLLGVNVGLFETRAHQDRLRGEDKAGFREEWLETMSAGIAVVVPTPRIIEIIRDTPTLIEARADHEKDYGDRVRAIPDDEFLHPEDELGTGNTVRDNEPSG